MFTRMKVKCCFRFIVAWFWNEPLEMSGCSWEFSAKKPWDSPASPSKASFDVSYLTSATKKVKCPVQLLGPAPLCWKREMGGCLSPCWRMNPTFAISKSPLQGSHTTSGFLPLEMLSFYNCPIWGILVHFHRDHPQLLGMVLGWGELQFFSFSINDILGCHGGLKAASVLSTEVTLLLHELTSSFIQNGGNCRNSGLEKALKYSTALWQGQEIWFIPDRCLYNLYLRPSKAFQSKSFQDLKVKNAM